MDTGNEEIPNVKMQVEEMVYSPFYKLSYMLW
jgi:hypothetical protein